MAQVLVNESSLEGIGDAIREKNASSDTYLPSEMGDAIRAIRTGGDVTSVNGKTGAVVLSASDVGAGTYSKPSGGIPKSDLASAVQTSLGKADTALQTAPVTSVNGKTGAVNITPADIGAKATQSAMYSPSASGTAVAFIDTITQNEQGVVTATKKTIPTASSSQAGLMSTSLFNLLWNTSDRALAAGDNFAPHADNSSTYPIKAGTLFTRRLSGSEGEFLYKALVDIANVNQISDATAERIMVSDLYNEVQDDLFNAQMAIEGNLAGLAVNAGQYVKADGTEGVNAALRCTNFIKIPDGALGFKMYGKTGATAFDPCVVIYDGSKTYFRRIEHSTSGVNVDSDGYLSFTFPTSSVISNYKYIRFNISNDASDADKILFEFSTINNAYVDTKLDTKINNTIGYVGRYTGTFASARETVDTGITLLANHSYKVYVNNRRNGRWTVFGLGNTESYKYILPSDNERIFTNDATNRYLALYNIDSTLDDIDVDVYDLGSIDDLVQQVPQRYRVAKNAAGDYTSVTQCFLALKDDPRPKIIEIWEGDYDIYQEYVDAGVPVYTGSSPGTEYFDYCVWVPENTHVIGKGFVRLKWMPDPTTAPITVNQCKCVSPLNVAGNAVIENIELYCKNGRYCIHNDPLGKPQFVGAVQKYINVKCYKEANDVDSGGNAYGFAPTIGFGIDRAMHYSYENCSFFNAGNGRAFYGHSRNSVGGTAITEAMSSQITVVGCIMDSGSYAKCVKLGNAGNSNVHIRVLFSGCYFSGDIDIENENGTTVIPNEFDVTMLACNNVTVTVADTNNRYPVKKYSMNAQSV